MRKFISKKVQKFNFRLIVDELNESNRTLKLLGLTFVILAILYAFNLVLLTPIIITCIALSGIFFIISDFFEHWYKITQNKAEIQRIYNDKKIGYLKCSKLLFQFLALISLIIAPYLMLPTYDIDINKFGNVFAMIAIGLTVYKTGLDNTLKNSNQRLSNYKINSKMLEELKKSQVSNDKNKDTN